MNIKKSILEGCIIIEPKVFIDERGFFLETFHSKRYIEAGINIPFVQDNRSSSSRGVLRGLHFQKSRPQGKLVMVTHGEVFDVAVDIRPDSATFGQYESVILTEKNKLQLYIPPGFAHGFCVLTEKADFQYKCTDYYDPTDEGGIRWDDPQLNIPWPKLNLVLSEKDSNLPFLNEISIDLINGFEK